MGSMQYALGNINNDNNTDMNIHYVNEQYDEGEYIFQTSCVVLSSDSPEVVQQKVQQLELIHFPTVIESIL